MEDAEESQGSEKVLILPLSENSKKITQILSNEKAMKMLEVLADRPMSASDVADKLEIPLTTVKYNLDGLIEAELIKVKETKWSRKGREVKIYEPVQKFIVVAPGSMKNDRSSVLSMLKKYLVLVAGALFAATGLEAITRSLMGAAPLMTQDTNTAPLPDENGPMAATTKDASVENTSGEAFTASKRAEADFAPMNEAERIPETDPREFAGYEYPVEDGSSNVTFDEQTLAENISGMDVHAEEKSPDMLASSTPNGTDSGADALREGMSAATGNQTDTTSVSQMANDNMSTVIEPASGIFQQGLLSHISVWFFFGCLFVITLLFIREIYNRNKNI